MPIVARPSSHTVDETKKKKKKKRKSSEEVVQETEAMMVRQPSARHAGMPPPIRPQAGKTRENIQADFFRSLMRS